MSINLIRLNHNTVHQHSSIFYFSTDVILLAIAFGSTVGLESVFVKSFDTRTRKTTIINATSIAIDMRSRLKIDPVILLILHALSGCDTTSFIRGITKKTIFSTFLKEPKHYARLIDFTIAPLSKRAIATAERLLIDCYSSKFSADSLDSLRSASIRLTMSRVP